MLISIVTRTTGRAGVMELDEALVAVLEALIDTHGGEQVQKAFNETEWSKQKDKEASELMLGMPLQSRTPRNFSVGNIPFATKKHDE